MDTDLSYFEALQAIDAESLRVRARSDEARELTRRAQELVFAEHSPEMSAEQCSLLWDQAWERGHSHGYHEVASEYQDLADWVRRFQAL